MRKRQVLAGLLVLATVGLLAGCGGSAAPGEPGSEEATPVVAQAEGKVVAEAVIEPARWSELRFESGGAVVEVLVEEGDLVSEGDLLVRFDPTDAQLGVLKAEAALASAQARLGLTKAGPRPEEIARAEAQLEAAQAALSQALAQRDELTAGIIDAEIAAAQAQLAAAQAEQEQAEELHNMTMKCFKFTLPDGDELEICPALGPPEEQTRYQLHAATGALAAAYAQLDAQQGGAESRIQAAQAGVWEASAQREVAQAQLDLLKAGSTPEDIAVAEAAVRQAQAALATAKGALEHTEIRAPFDGVVTEVNVAVGETATPGEVLVVLATLDRLLARTSDLTELDVGRVAEGQAAAVTVDALPDLRLSGYVTRIDLQSVDYRGDVTYPVFIELDENAPGLLWGMTAMVEIEAD